MEIITAILMGLMAIASPVGVIVDQLAEDAIRGQITDAEELYVRIDNVPNYQIINGRIEHARIAGRGVYIIPELRIDSIDLETDVVDVDLPSLQRGQLKLDEPAQAALRLVLEADDINQFLASDLVQRLLDDLRFSFPGQGGEREANRYGLADPSFVFIDGDRIRLIVDLQDRVAGEVLPITVELGFAIENGHQLVLTDPHITIDGEEAPPQLIDSFVQGANEALTLRLLEEQGVIARILELGIEDNALNLSVFAKVEPSSPLINRTTTTVDAVTSPALPSPPEPSAH